MRNTMFLMAAIAGASSLASAAPARAQINDYYVGQILLLANTDCPQGTREANGDLLPPGQYAELFSVYGTIYGGDGQTSFALPDLRGRAAIGAGQRRTGSYYQPGWTGGAETVNLYIGNLASHAHAAFINAVSGVSGTASPGGTTFANSPKEAPAYNKRARPDASMAQMTVTTSATGNGDPMPIRSPYLTLRYCVVMTGVYPVRP